jgi:hypothetical protein
MWNPLQLLKETLSILVIYIYMNSAWLMSKSNHFGIISRTILHVTIVASANSCTCNYIMMDPNFSHTFCDYHKFRWKIDEQWTYVIHYWSHPLMVDDQVVFATRFVIILKWYMAFLLSKLFIQNI